ncbi:MAG: hypothetical protein FD167_6101, partial [bacterium]
MEVLRYSPKGDVPIAANLSITFSQPMVALTSQTEAAQNIPVKLSPQPQGQWRWLGTKTLVFEPKNRFPMSTEYSIEVASGVKSATGQTLRTPVNWKFKTPTLTLKNYFPRNGSVGTDPIIFLEFDQEINKNTILQNIKVSSDKASYKVRLATQEEVDASKEIAYLVKSAKDKYSLTIKVDNGLASKLVAPLPNDTNINVSVEAGTLSTEGPLKTPTKQEFSFTTYSPLQVNSHSCYKSIYACEPSGYVNFSFNNELDPKSLDLSKAEMSPKLSGMKLQANGSYITVIGRFK